MSGTGKRAYPRFEHRQARCRIYEIEERAHGAKIYPTDLLGQEAEKNREPLTPYESRGRMHYPTHGWMPAPHDQRVHYTVREVGGARLSWVTGSRKRPDTETRYRIMPLSVEYTFQTKAEIPPQPDFYRGGMTKGTPAEWATINPDDGIIVQYERPRPAGNTFGGMRGRAVFKAWAGLETPQPDAWRESDRAGSDLSKAFYVSLTCEAVSGPRTIQDGATATNTTPSVEPPQRPVQAAQRADFTTPPVAEVDPIARRRAEAAARLDSLRAAMAKHRNRGRTNMRRAYA